MQEQNLNPFKTFPLISNQFDYIEFSLVRKSNAFIIVYTYIKPNHQTKQIDASCMVETGMVGSSYEECANLINKILSLGFFKTPVSAIGMLLDENLKQLAEINWNTIQKVDMDYQPTTIH